ncbi:hypothetical protein [Spirulina major]|uniref:hypothetical protein n=1 Tax=Spirulina major TaxID=270636 RepID=UPI001114731D|nr:hypothetical protein [Spirulina major]
MNKSLQVGLGLTISSVPALLVGVGVTLMGATLLVGTVQDALTLIGLSIVCTFGVSLVVWLPLCWLVGLVVIWGLILAYWLIHRLWGITIPWLERRFPEDSRLRSPLRLGAAIASSPSDEAENPHDSKPTTPTLTHGQQALSLYIRQALAKGYSLDKIHHRLQHEGWTPRDVEAAEASIPELTAERG